MRVKTDDNYSMNTKMCGKTDIGLQREQNNVTVVVMEVGE